MAELLYAFDSIDASRQFRAEQPGIGSLVRQPSHCRQVLVYGISRKSALLQMGSIADHHYAVECQTRFRAVPCDELIHRVLIDAAGSVRYGLWEGRFRVVKIWQT